MAKASKSPAKKKTALAKSTAPKSPLKSGNNPAVEICEIRNLTQATAITLSPDDLKTLTPADTFARKITGAVETLSPVPAKTDNIQVSWGVKTAGGKFKTKYRGVNGSLSYDAVKKTFSISKLKNVSKLSLGVRGVLDIGPESTNDQPNPVAAHLSINIGNLNPNRSWIINLSDKDNGDEGSYIELKTLLDWVKKKVPENDEEVELPETGPEASPQKLDPATFKILFNDFYINLTDKTFKFDVESKDGDSIPFGNFTIKKAGFIVTNEPYLEVEEEDDEDDEDDDE